MVQNPSPEGIITCTQWRPHKEKNPYINIQERSQPPREMVVFWPISQTKSFTRYVASFNGMKTGCLKFPGRNSRFSKIGVRLESCERILPALLACSRVHNLGKINRWPLRSTKSTWRSQGRQGTEISMAHCSREIHWYGLCTRQSS